jgi:hypothetical protein
MIDRSAVLLQYRLKLAQPKYALTDGAGSVFAVRILIHRQPAGIATPVQPIERLKIANAVYRSHNHVVICGGVIVVEMHMEEAIAGSFGQHNGFAHYLTSDEGVARIDGNADIGSAGFNRE